MLFGALRLSDLFWALRVSLVAWWRAGRYPAPPIGGLRLTPVLQLGASYAF